MARNEVVLPSVVAAIGHTPLVELARIARGVDGRLLAKLEYLNPGLSKKDRAARQMIEDAEADGRLAPGQTVVEMTSGNTGIGLAIVCGVKGYPFVAVMSRGNSPERARMLAALGAEVVLVDQMPGSVPGCVSGGDLDLVERAAERIVEERKAFLTDQFHSQGNFRAYYLHLATEILQQADGPVGGFCDFVGTGGTFAGCATRLKEANPATLCYVVEPTGAAVLAGKPLTKPGHWIQGGGYAKPSLDLLHSEHIDGYIEVDDETAVAMARRLAKEEGLFCGFSSGANVAAALQLLQGPCRGMTVVTIMVDSGLKYLSTQLWK